MNAKTARYNVEMHKQQLKTPTVTDIMKYVDRLSTQGLDRMYYAISSDINKELYSNIETELQSLGFTITALPTTEGQEIFNIKIEW